MSRRVPWLIFGSRSAPLAPGAVGLAAELALVAGLVSGAGLATLVLTAPLGAQEPPTPTPAPSPTPTPTPAPSPTPTPAPSPTPTPSPAPSPGPSPAPSPGPRRPGARPGERPARPGAPGQAPGRRRPAPKKEEAPKQRVVRPGPRLAITNARLPGVERPMVVVLVGGKVRAIVPSIRPQRGLTMLDARGGRVLPGRIDAWASLGSPDPLGNALDAFDPYDDEAVREALAGGVTSVFLNPTRGGGASGEGALIKLIPGAPLEQVVVSEGLAEHTSLGFGGPGAGGVRDYEALRKLLASARAYQDQWLEYREALEKYEKELKKLAAASRPATRVPRPGVRRTPGGPTPPPAPTPTPARPGAAPAPAAKGPAKPNQPRENRALERLLPVLDRELPLRIEAHRAEDIANALDLAEEFELRLVLEGASEAHLLADVLAVRKVPVVLGGGVRPGTPEGGVQLRRVDDLAARLERAGVRLVIGSDGWARAGSLAVFAARHAAAGLDPAAALAATTERAAELLGVGEHQGKLAAGYDADVVVYAPEELGAEVVEVTIVDGRIVYRRGK